MGNLMDYWNNQMQVEKDMEQGAAETEQTMKKALNVEAARWTASAILHSSSYEEMCEYLRRSRSIVREKYPEYKMTCMAIGQALADLNAEMDAEYKKAEQQYFERLSRKGNTHD